MTAVPYTIAYPTATGSITTDCKVSIAYDAIMEPNQIHPDFVPFKAIWDTGAMRSSISTKVVQQLGLKPYGYARVFHADGESIQNTYLVNILLPNKIEVKTIRVTEAKMTDIDVLIGMDIISLCDFAITSTNGVTTFSFEIPSVLNIDFTKE